ncbi:MAG TPA: hypothetical protein VNG32_05365 [Candidatus Dormibacteraeota bacterium]|nr:hypothetical protein [Candidatus Dormibacteraeota bacterium]
MTSGDFDPFQQPGESDEQHRHRLDEAFLAEDWTLRFQANGAEFRALGQALEEEQDPDKIVSLAEQRAESLVKGLGSGAISLWQRDVIAEREQFEADFGQPDQS